MSGKRRNQRAHWRSLQTARVGGAFWLWTCLPSLAASCDGEAGPEDSIVLESFATAGSPLKTYLVVDTTDTMYTILNRVTVEAEGIAGAGTLTIREPDDPVAITYTFDVPPLDSGDTGDPGAGTRSPLLYSYWSTYRGVSESHTVVFELVLESDGYAAVELHLSTNIRPDGCIFTMGKYATISARLTDEIGGDSGEP